MRAFVVGNGPSLKHTNLHHLTGEVSFACNNIHMIYPYTPWRPTHYVRSEDARLLERDDWLESMQAHLDLGCEIYCNDYFFDSRFGLRETEKAHILSSCTHHLRHFDHPECPHLWHLPVLCTFGSSVNVAVQIAHQQGYSPVYLVGCDLGYEDGKPSHFDARYEHGREQSARYANLDTLSAHMIAARSGAQVYNATLGGSLEVYERVDYENIFSGQRRESETHTPAFADR